MRFNESSQESANTWLLSKMDDRYPDEDEGENKRGSANSDVRGGGVNSGGGEGRFYRWPSSRIVRVPRAFGGKDRHSKVLTSKGLRDRRMRLSVNTAIQFYDLQDRLGYDQPSKAVEWLLKAAASSIAELPPINGRPFPESPKQLSDDNCAGDPLGFDLAEVDMDDGTASRQQVTKSSSCSCNSETSKSPGLSLSRSESRIKARERAKERAAEKEKETVFTLNPISQTTELFRGGINNVNNNGGSPTGSLQNLSSSKTNESNFFLKSPRQWSSTPVDYITGGLLGPPATRSGQTHPAPPNPFTSAALQTFGVTGDHHPDLHHFSFVPDQLIPVVNISTGWNSTGNNNYDNGGSNYSRDFSISSSANSSGLVGFDRGTLQSNDSISSSPCLLPHLQRFPDGFPPSSFIDATATVENHHRFLSGYDARLQPCYCDAHPHNAGRHCGQKGKG